MSKPRQRTISGDAADASAGASTGHRTHTGAGTASALPDGSAGKKRRDPPGMRRTSLYITADAADALEAATNHVVDAVGDHEMPRHAVLSALLLAGAEQADAVADLLIERRAAELTERLAALQQGRKSSK